MAATRAWVVCLWACSAAAIAPWSSWQKRVLGSEEPLRVGIIGAGIGGAATAHYVREQLPHAEIVVFEGRALGGRVKSLRAVHNDTTRASTFEAGASTFPATSPLLTELCGKLNITLAPQAARRHDGTYGVWDGRSVAYQQQQSVFLAVLSMLWRYGFSPLYLQKEVRAMESAFQQVYEHLADAAEHPAKRSAHELLAVLGLQDPSRMSLRAALRGSGLNTAFVEEVVDGVLRNNYGQTWGGVNALAGLLALRGRGDVLVAAESGNEGIVHGLLKTAGAYVLHANVTTVRYAHVDDRGAPLDMASPPNSTAPPPVKPVEVTFAGARGEARLRFDTVVVASPLPLAGLNLCTHRVPARPGPASPLAAEDTGPVAEAPQEREARDEDDNGTDAAVDADEGNGNESGPAVDAVNDTANATVGADAGAEEPGEHREDEAEDAAECSWAAPSVPYAPAHVAFVRARGVDAQFFGVEGDGAPTMLLTLDGVEEFTALQVIESNVTDVAVLRPRRDGGGGGDGDGDGAALEETNGTETLSAEAESPAGEAPAVQPSYSSAPTPDPVDLPTSAEAADVPPEDGAGHGEAAAAPPEPEAAAPPAEPLFGWLWGAPAAEPEPPSGEPAAAVDPAETGPTEGDANASEASEDAGQDAPPPADEGGASAAPAAGEECTEPAVEEAAADPAEAPAAEAEAEADPAPAAERAEAAGNEGPGVAQDPVEEAPAEGPTLSTPFKVYKIVSQAPLNDTQIRRLFSDATVLAREGWAHAHPILRPGGAGALPEKNSSDMKLAPRVYHPSSLERVLPTLEGAVVAAKNVANLIAQDAPGWRLGVDVANATDGGNATSTQADDASASDNASDADAPTEAPKEPPGRHDLCHDLVESAPAARARLLDEEAVRAGAALRDAVLGYGYCRTHPDYLALYRRHDDDVVADVRHAQSGGGDGLWGIMGSILGRRSSEASGTAADTPAPGSGWF